MERMMLKMRGKRGNEWTAELKNIVRKVQRDDRKTGECVLPMTDVYDHLWRT